MADGGAGPRSIAEQRLAELRSQGKDIAKRPRSPRYGPPAESATCEAQLSNVTAMADGNWVLRIMCPARGADEVMKITKMYGWRLRMTLELAPSSWD